MSSCVRRGGSRLRRPQPEVATVELSTYCEHLVTWASSDSTGSAPQRAALAVKCAWTDGGSAAARSRLVRCSEMKVVTSHV